MLGPCIGKGFISHERKEPPHSFRKNVWMVYADIEEIHQCLKGIPSLLASFPGNQLRTPVYLNERLRELDVHSEDVRIFALTQPGILDYSFNPVSFYFAFDQDELVALLADVTNTPWEERHCYALKSGKPSSKRNCYSFTFDKHFYVSPFLPMRGQYRLRLTLQREAVAVAMRLRTEATTFFAVLSLKMAPFSKKDLLTTSLLHPAQNLRTVKTIYWHAFRLLLKNVPVIPYTKKTAQKADRLHESSSVD